MFSLSPYIVLQLSISRIPNYLKSQLKTSFLYAENLAPSPQETKFLRASPKFESQRVNFEDQNIDL